LIGDDENSKNEAFQPGLLDILEESAAVKLQSFIRMKIAQKRTRKLRIVLRKIELIQKWFRVWILKKRTKTNMIRNNRTSYLHFSELQNWF